MSLAQRRHCGQRVQDVAHGAQADHEQAVSGLRVQGSILAQGRTQGSGVRCQVSGIREQKDDGPLPVAMGCAIGRPISEFHRKTQPPPIFRLKDLFSITYPSIISRNPLITKGLFRKVQFLKELENREQRSEKRDQRSEIRDQRIGNGEPQTVYSNEFNSAFPADCHVDCPPG